MTKTLFSKIICVSMLSALLLSALPVRAAELNLGYDSNHPLFNGFLNDGGKKPVNLQRYRGNIIFLVFWATWCQRCIKQIKLMDQFAPQAENKNIVFLPINIDFRGVRLVKKAYSAYEISHLRPVFDNTGKAVKHLNISVLPTTIVLDEVGIMQKRIVGQRKWNIQYVNSIITDIKEQQKAERERQLSIIQSDTENQTRETE